MPVAPRGWPASSRPGPEDPMSTARNDTDTTTDHEVDGPLTVSITRRVAAGDDLLMQAWVHAGTSMAERFDGFLGAGWVRSGAEDWHIRLFSYVPEVTQVAK